MSGGHSGAAYLSNPADYLTPGQGAAAYVGRFIRDNFATKPDGLLATADSGQAYTLLPANGTGALQVVAGKATAPANSGVAAYAQIGPLHDPAANFGAHGVTFTAYTTGNGSLAFPNFQTVDDGSGVPETHAHVTVSPTQWIVSQFVGGAPTTLGSFTFTAPLTADDATAYDIDCTVVGHTLTVVIRDATGKTISRQSVTDPRLYASGLVPTLEIYRPAATDTQAKVTSWYSGTAPQVPANPASNPQATTYAPNPAANYAVTNANAQIPGLATLDVWPPESGNVLLRVNLNLSMTGADRVFITFGEGAATYATIEIANEKVVGQRTAEAVVALAAGSHHTVKVGIWSLTNGTTTLLLDGPNGRYATFEAVPLAN